MDEKITSGVCGVLRGGHQNQYAEHTYTLTYSLYVDIDSDQQLKSTFYEYNK